MKTKELFKQMTVETSGLFQIHGFDLQVERNREKGEITFSTPVFYGGNFVPNSVRTYLHQRGFVAEDAYCRASIRIDEENYRVILSVRVRWNEDRTSFIESIEDYITLADEWRTLLNDRGEQDLIHILINQ